MYIQLYQWLEAIAMDKSKNG